MQKIENVPLEFIISIYDVELPKAIRPKLEKVEKFRKEHDLEGADCPRPGCSGILEYKGTQDCAADEGMNIRFICSSKGCGHTQR